MKGYDILLCDKRPTPLGVATYVRIHRDDMAPMGFRELWDVFSETFPGKWAVQLFPEKTHLLDQANKYHLFVLDNRPDAFDLTLPAPKHAAFLARYVGGE